MVCGQVRAETLRLQILTNGQLDSLQWRHHDRDCASNHRCLDCLLNNLFTPRSKKSSAPMAFARGIHRSPVDFPRKRPVKRKIFPLDDVIMLLVNFPSTLRQFYQINTFESAVSKKSQLFVSNCDVRNKLCLREWGVGLFSLVGVVFWKQYSAMCDMTKHPHGNPLSNTDPLFVEDTCHLSAPHEYAIMRTHILNYWPFVWWETTGLRWILLTKDQLCGALMFYLLLARISEQSSS